MKKFVCGEVFMLKNYIFILSTLVFFCVLFAAIIVMLVLKMNRSRVHEEEAKLTDVTTGIGNNLYFEQEFNGTISDFSRCLYHVAYIIIDISYLQAYHGATTFNDVVKYTASVLKNSVKNNDVAARITENGFVYAFQCTDCDEAKKQLKKMLNKLNEYTDVEENDKAVFHAALYQLNTFDRNSELVIFNLRRNCIKLMGTSEQIVYCDAHDMNKAIEEKLLFESLEKGFENREFKLYLQFIVDTKTKNIVSAEALSRWDNPEKGILTPGSYIEAMESSGLITRLDYYMFEMVCNQLHLWKGTEFEKLSVSCNFTRITISEDDFIEKLKNIYEKYSFDKSKLIIEITEDAIERNIDNAIKNIMACKEFGFRIALDDLGSGYTSLINLCDYPIDIVKLDRSILLKAATQKGEDLFKGMVALSHNINLKVVCEGVENEEHNDFVTTSECDYIQGWYYSRVLPVEECEGFVKHYTQKLNKEITV